MAPLGYIIGLSFFLVVGCTSPLPTSTPTAPPSPEPSPTAIATPTATGTPAPPPTITSTATPSLTPTLTPTPTRNASLVTGWYAGKIEFANDTATGAVNLAVSPDGNSVIDFLWLIEGRDIPAGPRMTSRLPVMWEVPGPWPLAPDGRFTIIETVPWDEDLWEMLVEGRIGGGQASGIVSIVRHSPLQEIWNSSILPWSARRL